SFKATISYLFERGHIKKLNATGTLHAARCGGDLLPFAPVRTGEPDDAETGAEALFRVRPLF
ncbi:MAG: hypothetical protein WBF43_12605, partial [Methylocella sp.]